jgi:multimeric flavodoxin WrbA
MRVVAVLGSPRRDGNSETIVKRFNETAEQLGAEVRTFALNEIDYRGCQGCRKCKTETDRCVTEDGLTEVLDAIREADVLVLASPIYFSDVTGQVKAFVDRTFSYLKPDFYANPNPGRLAPGKTLVFVQTQGADQSVYADIFPKYERFFKGYGFEQAHLVRACGVSKPGEVADRRDVMKAAEKTARDLLR